LEFARSETGKEPSGGKIVRRIQIRVTLSSLAKITLIRQAEKTIGPLTADSKFQKIRKLFIGVHNETLSAIAADYG